MFGTSNSAHRLCRILRSTSLTPTDRYVPIFLGLLVIVPLMLHFMEPRRTPPFQILSAGRNVILDLWGMPSDTLMYRLRGQPDARRALAAQQKFQIEPGPLAEQLRTFSREVPMAILFMKQDVQEIKGTAALRGVFNVKQALENLLAGAGCAGQVIRNDLVQVRCRMEYDVHHFDFTSPQFDRNIAPRAQPGTVRFVNLYCPQRYRMAACGDPFTGYLRLSTGKVGDAVTALFRISNCDHFSYVILDKEPITNAVEGHFTCTEAISRMLAGTSLSAKEKDGVIYIQFSHAALPN